MATKAKKKGRDPGSSPGRRGSRRLKVFRTPIGFHDAYVAAPSRKAALEAWGADSNIFAQGIAEEVTDPDPGSSPGLRQVIEDALARPGEVIRRVRGSAEEHVAAAESENRQRSSKPRASPHPQPLPIKARGEKAKKRPPKPSRDKLDAAEAALEKAGKKQRKALGRIDEQIRKLERERRDLQRKQERERDGLAEEVERARSAYQRAMRAWEP